MRKYILIVTILLFSFNSFAQYGLRFGLVGAVAFTGLKNSQDAGYDKKVLTLKPTTHFQRGIEFGYAWRYMGISSQLLWNTCGQKYTFGGNYAEDRLHYTSPSLQLNFNSNPRNDIRFSGYIGVAYGILTGYREVLQYSDPQTGALVKATIENNVGSVVDTNTITYNNSQWIYKKNDLSAYIGLGADFRLSKTMLLGVHARFNYGLQGIENNNKIPTKITSEGITYSSTIQPFYDIKAKFIADTDPNKVISRTSTNNVSEGIYVSLKYMMHSKNPLHYEMDGY